jgi:hypothetical protein
MVVTVYCGPLGGTPDKGPAAGLSLGVSNQTIGQMGLSTQLQDCSVPATSVLGSSVEPLQT